MSTLHGGTAPLAALTTIFTPPCPTTWLVTTSKLPSQFPSFPAAAAASSCDPPSWPSNLSGEGFQYYSPAICPAGFEVGPGCTLAATPRTAEGFPGVAAGETVAWCVPSGQSCTSDTTDFRGGIWGVSRTATGAGALVTVGPAMQIRFRDVDLSTLETHPLTPGLTLAGAATTSTTSTKSVIPTPDVVTASETVASTSTSAGATVGFITVKGKATTSTVGVITSGSTVETVVTEPTQTVNGGSNGGTSGGNNDNNSSSSSTSSGSMSSGTSDSGKGTSTGTSKKAFTAAIVMACLMSVTAIAIIVLFIVSRRRHKRRQQQTPADAEQGQDCTNAGAFGFFSRRAAGPRWRTPSPDNGSSSVGLASVGVGAWVRRKRPRWQVVWRRTMRWWNELQLLRPRRLMTGDNRRSWQRGQRTRQWQEQLPEATRSRARTPLAELPAVVGIVTDRAELEGSPVPAKYASRESDKEDEDDNADSFMNLKRGIPSRPLRDRSNQRLSWMSRLSRYMRGDSGRNTPASSGGAPSGNGRSSDDAGSSMSRTSTRSSRWTRADTASLMTADGGESPESSWEAFSRSRNALGKLFTMAAVTPAKEIRRGGTAGGLGGLGGLRVPSLIPGETINRHPSPATTMRSDRTGTPGGSMRLGTGSNRFSRLSDGTFGRMDSFISKDGSRIGDMPPVLEGGSLHSEGSSAAGTGSTAV